MITGSGVLYIPVWTLYDLLPPRRSLGLALGPSWPCPSCSIMSLLDLAGDSAEILLQGLLISNPHINLSFQ